MSRADYMAHLSFVEVIDPFWNKNFEPTSSIRVVLWRALTFARHWNSPMSARDTSRYSESTRHLELKQDLREHPNIALDTSSSHSASAAWI